MSRDYILFFFSTVLIAVYLFPFLIVALFLFVSHLFAVLAVGNGTEMMSHWMNSNSQHIVSLTAKLEDDNDEEEWIKILQRLVHFS